VDPTRAGIYSSRYLRCRTSLFIKALKASSRELRQGELLRTPYMRSSEDLTRRPLVDSSYMGEQIRPTGITYEAAMDAAQNGGGIDFEGRNARVVHLSQKSGRDTPHSARIELDLGDGYLTLLGYFSREDEFMEEARERPF
jgi:hypothetical protein